MWANECIDAGQAALPGGMYRPVVTTPCKSCILMKTGRADTLEETPFQTARREAREEIGLPEVNQALPRPFTVEHLCELPANLARTELVVRPCVALLHSFDEATGANEDPEVSLIPKLDAQEVAAVFTAPFRSFLRVKDVESGDLGQDGDSEEWYQGAWTEWHQSNWRSEFLSFFLFLFSFLKFILYYYYCFFFSFFYLLHFIEGKETG